MMFEMHTLSGCSVIKLRSGAANLRSAIYSATGPSMGPASFHTILKGKDELKRVPRAPLSVTTVTTVTTMLNTVTSQPLTNRSTTPGAFY